MENQTAPAATGKPAKPADPTATYTVQMTGAQIFGFADLVRRLTAAPAGPEDGESPRYLRKDLADALWALVDLTPEPSDDDGDAYLSAVRTGQLPAWNRDGRPLTETTAERVARERACREDRKDAAVVAHIWDDSPCPVTGRVTAELDDERVDVAWGGERHKDNPQTTVEWRDELRPVSRNQ